MTLSRFYKDMDFRNQQHRHYQSTIRQAVISDERQWLLESARQVFLSPTSGEWLFMEAFRPAVETVSSVEAGDWMDLFANRLESAHLFSGGVGCHRLTWSFLEHLGQHHAPDAFRQIIYRLLPSERDPIVFRAMAAHCRHFPEDTPVWATLLSSRADIRSEPDEHIRCAAWQTLAGICRQHRDSPIDRNHDVILKIWDVTGDILRHSLLPPGERSSLVTSAAMNYLTSNSPALAFQLWNDIQLRVDPRHEPDWMLRQSIWEALDGQDESIQFQARLTAHNLIDHQMETHPTVLRQLWVYGQQLG